MAANISTEFDLTKFNPFSKLGGNQSDSGFVDLNRKLTLSLIEKMEILVSEMITETRYRFTAGLSFIAREVASY
jgi:hypothetical protein